MEISLHAPAHPSMEYTMHVASMARAFSNNRYRQRPLVAYRCSLFVNGARCSYNIWYPQRECDRSTDSNGSHFVNVQLYRKMPAHDAQCAYALNGNSKSVLWPHRSMWCIGHRHVIQWRHSSLRAQSHSCEYMHSELAASLNVKYGRLCVGALSKLINHEPSQNIIPFTRFSCRPQSCDISLRTSLTYFVRMDSRQKKKLHI